MVLPAADPERRQLLDVGGGSGAIAIELCRACPG
jgi:precorrin-6B methylase 2